MGYSINKPKFPALIIQFTGKAKTSWTESKSVRQDNGNNTWENVAFTGNEEYFSTKYNLAGGPNCEIQLASGLHEYPFNTTLPPVLPSSFEGKHGSVTYTVRATLVRPWKPDQHVERVFTVVTPIDLNRNAKAKEPVELDLEKWFCCWCCRSGPLMLVISLPYSGFVPGQSIPITLEVDNTSNVRVNAVVIKLIKVMKWKALQPSTRKREEEIDMVKMTLEAVEPKASRTYTQEMAVPVMPLSDLSQCSIIHCSYMLQVTAEVSGMHINLYGEVPIFLGTVPLHAALSASFTPSAPLPP